jgi:hypothetical protein
MASNNEDRSPLANFDPTAIHQLFLGLEIPDPITFVVSPQYLNRPNLYPRQATLLKCFFLREDLFTPYDYQVVAEWDEQYRTAKTTNEQRAAQAQLDMVAELDGDPAMAQVLADLEQLELNEDRPKMPIGGTPDLLRRMRAAKALGYQWFREILLVMGRRAGKGHISALAMAYVLWNYMAKGDPQDHYGVDRDKKLACLIFAGKREQAKANLWRDLVNVVTGGPCFAPYIASSLGEKLSVYAPHDFIRIDEMMQRGIKTALDMATFEILPKESTLMAGRGPASFCLDPMTPVLTADLEWKPIKDLQPGEHLVGVDEYPEEKGRQRKLRDAEVKKVWWTRKEALRLTFEDGSNVVCSRDHRWLTRDKGKGGATKWRFSRNLTIGSHIKHLADPWEEDRSWEAGYLAGMYDGEGCVPEMARSSAGVLIAQKPGVVLDETKAALKELGFEVVPANVAAYNPDDSAEEWAIRGTAECMRFLGQVRPRRLLPRARRVWEGIAMRGGVTPSGRARDNSYKTIVSIEELPEQDLVDIETSTGTFIANGLVSHNCMGFDEMAHVVASGANRSAEEVYKASVPSLDQFKKDGFLIEPSSPWQMTGQFYSNYERSVAVEPDGEPTYPAIMMIQLASWDIYLDWQIAHELPLFPEGFTGDNDEYENVEAPGFRVLKNAIQTYDDQMRKLEKADPDTFAVERRAQWATVMDAYLDPDKVDAVFGAWAGRPPQYGGQLIVPTTEGILSNEYKGHADPSSVNCRFGIACAHVEYDLQGRPHVVFDKIHHFDPADFPNHTIDYEEVEDWIWDDIIAPFQPAEFTFDQYNSVGSTQKLVKKVAKARLPKKVNVFIRDANATYNWQVAECFKAAINMGLVHAPEYEEGALELKFLQKAPKANRVDHPTVGPVQTKDIADAIMITTWSLIGEWITGYKEMLNAASASGALMGGLHGSSPRTPEAAAPDQDSQAQFDALRRFSRTRTGRDGWEAGLGRHRTGYRR